VNSGQRVGQLADPEIGRFAETDVRSWRPPNLLFHVTV
jgi:hypothetical protein